MGISIVVPAHKILEVLNHPELVEARRKADEEIAREIGKEHIPVQDSGFAEPAPKKPFTQKDFESALRVVSRKRKQDKN
jgi:hypothetical protein